MQENKHWFLSLKKASLQVQPQQSKHRAEVKMTVFFFLEVSLLDTHNELLKKKKTQHRLEVQCMLLSL